MKSRFVLLCFIPLISCGQNIGLQLGPLASFSKKGGSGYGGEFIVTANLSQSVSLGLGVNAILFKNYADIYKPLFGTIKLNIPVNLFVLNFDANLGYGSYKQETTTGGFYFASGLTFSTLKNVGPYISIHYSNYEFHTTKMLIATTINETHSIEGVTLSAGYRFKIKRK